MLGSVPALWKQKLSYLEGKPFPGTVLGIEPGWEVEHLVGESVLASPPLLFSLSSVGGVTVMILASSCRATSRPAPSAQQAPPKHLGGEWMVLFLAVIPCPGASW